MSTMGIDKEHKCCCLLFGMRFNLSTISPATHWAFHYAKLTTQFHPNFSNFFFHIISTPSQLNFVLNFQNIYYYFCKLNVLFVFLLSTLLSFTYRKVCDIHTSFTNKYICYGNFSFIFIDRKVSFEKKKKKSTTL